MFSKNVEIHLSESSQDIDYVLKMCGPSEEDFHPSILVFCRTVHFKRLQKILRSKQLAPQYLLRKTTPRFSLNRWLMRSPPILDNKPLFNIYFWSAQRPRNLLGTGHTEVSVRRERLSTLPMGSMLNSYPQISGSRIYAGRSDRQLCTIGCALQIGSELYGLTAAHALARETGVNPEYSSSVRTAVEDRVLPTPSPEAENEDSDMSDFVSDVSYDDLVSDQTTKTEESEEDEGVILARYAAKEDISFDNLAYSLKGQEREPGGRPSRQTNLAPTSLILPPSQRSTIPRPTASLADCGERTWQATRAIVPRYNSHWEPHKGDFDWALINLSKEDYICPDAFIDYIPTFFETVDSKDQYDGVHVLVITSLHRVKVGRLQFVPAFIGGITIGKQTRMWSLIMFPGHGKNPGHFKISSNICHRTRPW